MRLHLGTSGFSYPAWKGSFYPKDVKPKGMLAFYAKQFSAVEINASFYRLPTEAMLTGWLPQVADPFVFALKAPQRLTHYQRLLNTSETLERFITVARTLGSRLGPLLFQLPPRFACDPQRLADFLQLLPRDLRAVLEFRDPSWFDDEVFRLLRERGIALCWEEADSIESPFHSTADFGYLRLRRLDYDPAKLAAWVLRIREQPWTDAYVFFKHEDEARGPGFAAEFGRLWQR